jgi:hypothetical protein
MVTEPAQSTVATFASGLSAGALALFGVTYLGLLWALIGAVVSLMFTPPQSRGLALVAVVGGMFTGAVLGDIAVLAVVLAFPSAPLALTSKIHLGFAFIIGAGAKRILGALIEMLVKRIGKAGGEA